MKLRNISKEVLQRAVDKSDSYSKILKNLGLSRTGGNHPLLYKKLNEFSIGTDHFQKKVINGSRKFNLEDVLVENSPFLSSHHLKLRLIKERVLENKCNICGLEPAWQGKKLSLQLHHINGKRSDCRRKNLELLCPNCHTQTKSFCGKKNICGKKKRNRKNTNKAYTCPICDGSMKTKKSPMCRKCADLKHRKANRPAKETLIELLSNHSMLKLGKMFGVSDNAVRKWAKKYEII